MSAPTDDASVEQKQAEEKWKALAAKFITIEAFSEDSFTDTLNLHRRYFETHLLDVNRAIKPNGTTMLHTAAWFQRALVIKALLELGANPNVPNKTSLSTPLHFACENCVTAKSDAVWQDCLKYLLAKGADLGLKNKEGKTPMDLIAVSKPGFDIVKFQRDTAGAAAPKVNDKAERERRIAELRKNAEAASKSAAAAAAGPAAGTAPKPAAAAAAAKPAVKDQKLVRQAGIIKLELLKLFDALPENPKKEKDILEMLQEREDLVRNGYLEINAPIPQKRNQTFLHLAVLNRASDLILYLLSTVKANPNAQDPKGETPLHYACVAADKQGSREIIAALIESGADATIPNFMFKKTPLQLVANNPDVAQWMERLVSERNAKLPPPPQPARAPSPMGKPPLQAAGSGASGASGGPGASTAKDAAKGLVAEMGKASDAIDRNLNASAVGAMSDMERKLALGKKGAAVAKQADKMLANATAEAKHVEDAARRQREQAEQQLADRIKMGKRAKPASGTTNPAAASTQQPPAAATPAPAPAEAAAASAAAPAPAAGAAPTKQQQQQQPADKSELKRQAHSALMEAEEAFQKTQQKQTSSKDAAEAAMREKMLAKREKKIDAGVKNVLADAERAFKSIGAKTSDASKNADAELARKLAAGRKARSPGTSAASAGGAPPGAVVGLDSSVRLAGGGGAAGGVGGGGGGMVNIASLPAPMAVEALKLAFLEKYGGATKAQAARKFAERKIVSNVPGLDALFDLYDTHCTGRLTAAQVQSCHEHLHGCECDPYLVAQLLLAVRDHPDNRAERERELKARGLPPTASAEDMAAAGVPQPTVGKPTFQHVLEQLHVACRRDTQLSWEFDFLDADECGALGDAAAVTLFEFNDFMAHPKLPVDLGVFKDNTKGDLRYPTARDTLFGFPGFGFPQNATYNNNAPRTWDFA